MDDTTRRLLLRATLKLLTLFALVAVVALFIGGDGDRAPPNRQTSAVLTVELGTIRRDQPQRLEWRGRTLHLLWLEQEESPRLFLDRGGNLNCPLSWQPPGTGQAPQRPWPGGFRDQCSGTWYHFDGTVLPGQATTQDLQAVPYRILDGHLLQIGGNGDNAAPAVPASN